MKRIFSYLIEITSNKTLVNTAFVVHNYIIINVKTVVSTTHTYIILIISASYIILHISSTLNKMNIIIEVVQNQHKQVVQDTGTILFVSRYKFIICHFMFVSECSVYSFF